MVGGIVDPNTIHILLVPVRGTTPTGVDVLETQKGETTVSTIMDFTQPCPSMCDVDSPLYGR